MVSDEQKKNTRRNMVETLSYLSSADFQRQYQEAVPFINVPIELACQWEQISDLLRDQEWFRVSLTPPELKAVEEFNCYFDSILETFPEYLPDLESLKSDSRWERVGIAAQRTLAVLQGSTNGKQ